jgi:hypothetical protein
LRRTWIVSPSTTFASGGRVAARHARAESRERNVASAGPRALSGRVH